MPSCLHAPRSKYSAKVEYVNGLRFPSKAEATKYRELLMLQRDGLVKEIELQPRFEFPFGAHYTADFRVTWIDGRVEVMETKGFRTADFKLRLKAFHYYYPDVVLTINGKDSRAKMARKKRAVRRKRNAERR